MPKAPLEHYPHQDESGQWHWQDGTSPTVDEWRSIYETLPNTDVSKWTGTGPDVQADKEAVTALKFQHAANVIETDSGKPDPLMPSIVTGQSPGGSLNTAQSDEDKAATQKLLQDLQQQAATGGGAWEQSLKNATDKASAGAMALGQGQQQQTGGSQLTAMQGIGNAQAGAQQRAVGQGNILREKSKTAAQDAIGGLTSGMQGNAANQAATQAGIKQQIQDTNLALIGDAEKVNQGRASAMAGGLSSMSDGGEVPGRPRVFGDDQKNDTVPAMLSPKEIVLPLSVTQSDNAPQAAAEFVAALERKERGGHSGGFADGGEAGTGVDPSTGLHGVKANDFGAGNYVGNWAMPHIFGPLGFAQLRQKYAHPGAPSIENGGLLESQGYNAARAPAMQNNIALMERAQGRGPTVAPQMMQNTADSNMATAMQAQASGRGGQDLVARSTEANQGAAGQAADVTAQEQAAGQHGASQAYLEQQARDLAFSKAQQEAAWRNTMINAGLGLDQQNQIRNIFSGVGQGATALVGLGQRNANQKPTAAPDQPYTFDSSSSTGAQGDFPTDTGSANDTSTNISGDSGPAYAFAGGRIEKKDKRESEFIEALCRGGYA